MVSFPPVIVGNEIKAAPNLLSLSFAFEITNSSIYIYYGY